MVDIVIEPTECGTGAFEVTANGQLIHVRCAIRTAPSRRRARLS